MISCWKIFKNASVSLHYFLQCVKVYILLIPQEVVGKQKS